MSARHRRAAAARRKEESNKAMAILLRTQSVQDRIEGRASLEWGEDDYAVVDETLVGRISKQRGYPDRIFCECKR
jgi:hypothetical protein